MAKKKAAPDSGLSARNRWYHGSPLRLTVLAAGASVTSFAPLAKAFSHKPGHIDIEVKESDETGERTVTLRHNGKRTGYLYRVYVEHPGALLRPHPTPMHPPCNEMLANVEMPVQMVCELPVAGEYIFTEKMATKSKG